MNERKYPVSIQNLVKLRKDGDAHKTAFVYKFTDTGSYCFLVRLRRLGKRLLLSVLEAYLQRKPDLFFGFSGPGEGKRVCKILFGDAEYWALEKRG